MDVFYIIIYKKHFQHYFNENSILLNNCTNNLQKDIEIYKKMLYNDVDLCTNELS